MKKLLLTSIAALLLATGAAHAVDFDKYDLYEFDVTHAEAPLKAVFVHLALEANTKTFEWIPTEVYEILQECLDKKKELENKPENIDLKGFIIRPFKCIRYRR